MYFPEDTLLCNKYEGQNMTVSHKEKFVTWCEYDDDVNVNVGYDNLILYFSMKHQQPNGSQRGSWIKWKIAFMLYLPLSNE
jgi:hypothetical protein